MRTGCVRSTKRNMDDKVLNRSYRTEADSLKVTEDGFPISMKARGEG